MDIDSERFPESARLLQVLDSAKEIFECSDIKVGNAEKIHTLSQIKENLLQLSAEVNLDSEVISAVENEAADILIKLRIPNEVLYITHW